MKYANHIGYSDINPYEVVRVVSDKTLEVRRMKAERDMTGPALDFRPGGFFATCVNQMDQQWIITSDETERVIRIRLGKNGWKCAHGNRFKLSDTPVKFYDFNF